MRVAVVGVGQWGPNVLRAFQAAADVRWVIDSRRERLNALAPGPRCSTELSDALSDPEVDAVAISTPTSTHFELCTRALQAGKHVLVEKPLTTSVADARALEVLADEQKRVLMVGHVFLFNAAVRQVKAVLTDNALGTVQYLTMVRANLGPIRADVNAAWDLASHDVSIADYWLDSNPIAVSAHGGSWLTPGVHDAVFATLTYPGGVLVNLHSSWLSPRKNRDITVVGSRRMLTFDDLNKTAPVQVHDRGVVDGVVRDGPTTVIEVEPSEPLRAEVEHFIECVREHRRPLTDVTRSTAIVRTLEAIDRSLVLRGAEVRL